MTPMTSQRVAEVTGGQLLHGAADVAFRAVFTDTRAPVAGGLFVALTGDRFDAHGFLDQALAGGAGGLLVSKPRAVPSEVPPGLVVLVVRDTLEALTEIAREVRRRYVDARVVAVTGSAGKTTVKDMIAAALGAFGPVGCTPGNFNNHIGLPLTLCGLTGAEDFLVLELGMSAPGEIAALTAVASPDVGLVTNASAAHLEFFQNVDAIADAKAELYAGLDDAAVAVANADDPRMLARARALHGARLVTFGEAAGATVRVVGVREGRRGITVSLRVNGVAEPQVRLTLAALGRHNALNVAAALAVVVALGLDLQAAAAALSRGFRPAKHRLNIVAGTNGLTILDDSYNANPASTRAALATLAGVAGSATTGAVIGTMRELGPSAAGLHRGVGVAAAEAGLSWVAATGAHAEDICAGARAAGVSETYAVADAAELTAAVKAFAGPGRWLLLKGSRGERLERLLLGLGEGG